MPVFKVCWEIQLDAENPLEAAKLANRWLQEQDNSAVQFYVQEDNTKEVFSVDLLEEDEDAVLLCKDGYTPIIK